MHLRISLAALLTYLGLVSVVYISPVDVASAVFFPTAVDGSEYIYDLNRRLRTRVTA